MKETLRTLADMICIAARTAPKAKGIDNIETKVISEEEKEALIKEMMVIAEKTNHKGFKRDSKGIEVAEEVVLIGTKFSRMNLKVCGLCGAINCADAEDKDTVCIFNPGDLGIAVGSAVSKAADFRLDNRIFYTAGYAARALKLLPSEVKIIYAIPLSVKGKNPFFDRG